MNRFSLGMFCVALGGALALTTAACGGSSNGSGGGPDAGSGGADAAPTADAAPRPTLLRSGTVAITQAEVANFGPGTVNGALNLLSFDNVTTDTGTPVPGYTSSVGGCAITIYDVANGDTQGTPTDEGAVTITGTNNGDVACAFDADLKQYVCQSTNATIAGGTTGNGDGLAFVGGTNSTATLTSTGNAPFDPTMVGMSITLTGFGTVGVDGTYAITNVNNAGTVLNLYSPASPGVGVTSTGSASTTYTTFVGTGPFSGGFSYLPDATDIEISKPDSDQVPAFDVTMQAAGNGLTLASNPDMGIYTPDAVPFDTNPISPVTFSCDDTADGGTCGSDGSGGLTKTLVVNGVTTDGVVDPSDPTDMPAPVKKFATFTCSTLASGSITLDQGAMQAILGTNPTRIQTSVGWYRGSIQSSGTSDTNIVLGHQIIGYSSPPPAQ